MSDETTACDRDLGHTIALMQVSESVTLTGPALQNVLRALAGAPTANVADEALEILGDDDGRIDLSAIAAELGGLRAEVSMLRSENRRLAAAPEGVDAADELEEHFIEANERLGDALVQIGMALGLPRPTAQNTWGAPEILAKIRAAAPEGAPTEDVAAIIPDAHRVLGASVTSPNGIKFWLGTYEQTPRETAADEQAPFESDVPCTCETGACIADGPGHAPDTPPAWQTLAHALADELTVAQAAIQRVEDLYEELCIGRTVGVLRGLVADKIRRALDGDTTEEGR